jgi:hypothetical protein
MLIRMNNEAKVRRSTRSVVLGKAKVISFEDIEVARAPVGVTIMPSRGRMSCLSAPVGGSRPNDQRVEIPTVGRDTLYCSDQGSFYTCPSMCLQLMSAYEDLERVKDTKKNTCLIYVVYIFGENYRARQLFSNYGEPVYNFIVYMTIMSILIYCFHSHNFKLWVAFTEGLWPILSRRFDVVTIGRGNLENGGTLKHDNMC